MAASAWTTTPARALDLLSDERLARLAARGDQRAFSALFERHQAGVTRYCRTILRHAADAEDAAQNAMVAAHRSLESGTVPMRVKPWLYKIAHNEAISLVRLRKPSEELDEATLPTVADAEEAGEVRRRLGQLMADLQALTERQREAVVLRELCGLEYREIATTLGSSEAAAQQTVFEARSALQQFDEGRALGCEGIQRAMSECDGMRLRTRRFRAHLRGCECCRSFEAALLARRRDLGLLFPPTGAAGGVLAALARIFGGGGGEPLLAGLGLKGAAIGLAVLAGGGTVAVTATGGDDKPKAAISTATAAPGAARTSATPQPAATAQGRRTAGRRGATARKDPGTPRPRAGGTTTTAGAAPASGAGGTTLASTDGGGFSGGNSSSGGGPGSARDTPGTGTAHVNAPAQAPAPVADVVDTVNDTVSGVTQTAGDAVGDVVDTVTDTATGAVDTVTDAANDTVGGVTDVVTGALPKLP